MFIFIEFIVICLVSIPMIVGIANIMLANNICDLEEDIANKRHTLPYYIGKKNAIIFVSNINIYSLCMDCYRCFI